MAFGEMLRDLRVAARLTQEELSERSGLSVRAISDIERGRSRRPNRSSVRQLVDALGLPPPTAEEVLVAARAAPTTQPPAPAGADRPAPAQLPPAIRDFTGRAADLARLDALSVDIGPADPIVIAVLDGVAGAGKTALAVHWAHRVRDRFPDGQLFLNLRGFGEAEPVTPADALATFLRTLGMPAGEVPEQLDERSAALRTHLAGRRMLVLLDNARDAEQVRPLLPGTGCLVLITSRNQLRGLAAREGARRITLDRLGPADAIALVAGAVGADRVRREPRAADELVELCERLPLALRLVAERLGRYPDQSLAALATELRSAHARLDLLTDDERTTVGAVIGWSYRSLDAEAARVFRLLGLHPAGDAGVAAVAALAGLPVRDARALLDRLVAVHLVDQRESDRYDLHDLLRAYAARQAEAIDPLVDRRAAIRRMLDWYLHTMDSARKLMQPGGRTDVVDPVPPDVTPLVFDSSDDALAWFGREERMLQAVIRYSEDVGEYHHTWQLVWTFSPYLFISGDRNSYVDLGALALAAAERGHDRHGQAQAHHTSGIALTRVGRFAEAIDHHRAAMAIYRDLGDRVGEVKSFNSAGVAYWEDGQFTAAIDTFERALEIDVGDTNDVAIVNLNMGGLYLDQGDYAKALHHTRICHEESQRIGYAHGVRTALSNLGGALAGLGDHRGAGRAWREAYRLFEETGSDINQADLLLTVGQALRDIGRVAMARKLFLASRAMFEAKGDKNVGKADLLLSKLDAPLPAHDESS